MGLFGEGKSEIPAKLRRSKHLDSSINDVAYEIVAFLEGTTSTRFSIPFVNQPIVIAKLPRISKFPFKGVEIGSLFQ